MANLSDALELNSTALASSPTTKYQPPAMYSFQPRLKIRKITNKKPPLYLINEPRGYTRHRREGTYSPVLPRPDIGEPDVPKAQDDSAMQLIQLSPLSAELPKEEPKPETPPDRSPERQPERPSEEVLQLRLKRKNDPYYMGNLLESEQVASLNDILGWDGDVCYTHLVGYRHLSPTAKTRVVPKLKDLECHCEQRYVSREAFIRLMFTGVPCVRALERAVVSMRKISMKVRKQVQHPTKLLVFNIEGLLIDRNERNEWVVRPKLGRALQKLQFFFQLVFVYEAGFTGILTFVKLLKQEGIEVSGLYEANSSRDNIASYATIFEDFNVIMPASDVLILSALHVANEEMELLEPDELVACPQGSTVRILATRACPPCYEYANAPVCLLVPRLVGNMHAISSFSVARVIISYREDHFSNIIFSSQLVPTKTHAVTRKALEVVGKVTAAAVRELEATQQTVTHNLQLDRLRRLSLPFCPLHNTCIMQQPNELATYFVSMKLSNFMNSQGPEPVVLHEFA